MNAVIKWQSMAGKCQLSRPCQCKAPREAYQLQHSDFPGPTTFLHKRIFRESSISKYIDDTA